MKKVVNKLHKFSNILEIIIAVLVIAAVLVEMLALIGDLGHVWSAKSEHIALTHYLEDVLEAVIGIEFVKMLLHPDTDTILEILVFVVTRHMIVQTTSVYEDLVVIISVVILLIVKKHLSCEGHSIKKLLEFKHYDDDSDEKQDGR